MNNQTKQFLFGLGIGAVLGYLAFMTYEKLKKTIMPKCLICQKTYFFPSPSARVCWTCFTKSGNNPRLDA